MVHLMILLMELLVLLPAIAKVNGSQVLANWIINKLFLF
jgi:hypothetical protein